MAKLQPALNLLGIPAADTERRLGIDYNPQGNKKRKPTRLKRHQSAKARWKKAA